MEQEERKGAGKPWYGRIERGRILGTGIIIGCIALQGIVGNYLGERRAGRLEAYMTEAAAEQKAYIGEMVEEQTAQILEYMGEGKGELSGEHGELGAILERMHGELERSIAREIQAGTQRTARQLSGTDGKVERIRDLYQSILEEEKKQRVEDVYRDSETNGKYEEGIKLFGEKRYAESHLLMEEVCRIQGRNEEARFYAYYSLFLKNPSDAEQYQRIKEGLSLLERNGYTRKEIAEIREYIEKEEGAR